MKYTKPPLPFPDQLDLLKQRGLHISDTQKALHILEHINYYRLSAYFPPLQSQVDQFNRETSLDDVLYLYNFDERLRLLLSEALACIEVSAKTQIAHYLAIKYGPFSYCNENIFNFSKPPARISYEKWLAKVKENISRSSEEFKAHFFSKYDEESDLPIWMAIEIMSFGQVSQLYRGMKKLDRQDIARGYFRIDQRLMVSWLHTIVYIRNLCAHHSRIWNRQLAIRPLKNKKDSDWSNLDGSKIFSVFMLLKKMTHYQDKWDEWCGKWLSLLGEFSELDLSRMGFPDDWKNRLVTG